MLRSSGGTDSNLWQRVPRPRKCSTCWNYDNKHNYDMQLRQKKLAWVHVSDAICYNELEAFKRSVEVKPDPTSSQLVRRMLCAQSTPLSRVHNGQAVQTSYKPSYWQYQQHLQCLQYRQRYMHIPPPFLPVQYHHQTAFHRQQTPPSYFDRYPPVVPYTPDLLQHIPPLDLPSPLSSQTNLSPHQLDRAHHFTPHEPRPRSAPHQERFQSSPDPTHIYAHGHKNRNVQGHGHHRYYSEQAAVVH